MKTQKELITRVLKNLKFKKYFIHGKVEEVVEVTKDQLEIIKDKCTYIEIRYPDIEGLLHDNGDSIVGVLKDNIGMLIKDLQNYEERTIYRTLTVEFIPNSRINREWKTLKDKFTFSEAIELIKQGYKVKRKSDKKTKYTYIDDEDCVEYKDGTKKCFQISVIKANGERVRYDRSFDDYFAVDWVIVKIDKN